MHVSGFAAKFFRSAGAELGFINLVLERSDLLVVFFAIVAVVAVTVL